jgi:hypothetical protein
MSIHSTMKVIEASREEALRLFITAAQAMPGIIPQGLSCENIFKYLFEGAEKLIDYVEYGKRD